VSAVPEANAALAAALRRVRDASTPDTLESFYRSLLGARLIVPLADAEPAASDEPAPDDEGVRLWTTPPEADGTWKLLAFTDDAAVSAWRPGTRTVEVPAMHLFAMAATSPTSAILCNVAGPVGAELPRDVFVVLAEGEIPRVHGGEAHP